LARVACTAGLAGYLLAVSASADALTGTLKGFRHPSFLGLPLFLLTTRFGSGGFSSFQVAMLSMPTLYMHWWRKSRNKTSGLLDF
jgi:hypothetical protein